MVFHLGCSSSRTLAAGRSGGTGVLPEIRFASKYGCKFCHARRKQISAPHREWGLDRGGDLRATSQVASIGGPVRALRTG